MKKQHNKSVLNIASLNPTLSWVKNKFVRPVSKKSGLSPGSLVHVGHKKIEEVRLELMDYDENHLTEKVLTNIEEAFPFKDLPTITWLDVTGIHDIKIIEKIGNHFSIHPLVLEDILNTGQRPSFDDYEEYLFVALKLLSFNNKTNEVESEHVSLIVGKNYVITFQEREGDLFEPIRERLRVGKGRIRKSKSDYLGYAILDIVVDNYFLLLEGIGDQIQNLEEVVGDDPDKEVLNEIHKLKRELIFLRKSIWPLRDVLNKLEKSDSKLINKQYKIFFRDVYDHSVQVIDTVESYRDMVSGLQDLFLSQISNKMNEVMKVLTIFAAIFIPLTFIAGIYGMNFENMPELSWPYGYLMVWGVFAVVGFGMLIIFKKKKWL